MPPFVLGLAIVRGFPAPIVDAARLLNPLESPSPPMIPPRSARFVSLKLGERTAALAVDAVLDVRAVAGGNAGGYSAAAARGGSRRSRPRSVRSIPQLLLVLEAARLVPESVWSAIEASWGASRDGARIDGAAALSRLDRPKTGSSLRRHQARVSGRSFGPARGQEGPRAAPYLDRLEGTDIEAELQALAPELTVPETYFFRHIDQFRAFADVALPQAQSRAGADPQAQHSVRGLRLGRGALFARHVGARTRCGPGLECRHSRPGHQPGHVGESGARRLLGLGAA